MADKEFQRGVGIVIIVLGLCCVFFTPCLSIVALQWHLSILAPMIVGLMLILVGTLVMVADPEDQHVR